MTSKTLDHRMKQHIRDSTHAQIQRRARWVFSLIKLGLSPKIEAIELGTGDGWQTAERRWIAHYKAAGAQLVNCTDGGDGTPGWGTAEERKARGAKISATMLAGSTSEQRSTTAKNIWAARTPEQRKAFSDGSAKRVRAERIASTRDAQARKTQEQRSAASRKQWEGLTREQRSARRLAQITPEQRSEAARKRNASLTAQQLTDIAKRRNAKKTPEQRHAFAVAGAAKRWG